MAAVRLFGAADALREALAAPITPDELVHFEPIADGLRAALGD